MVNNVPKSSRDPAACCPQVGEIVLIIGILSQYHTMYLSGKLGLSGRFMRSHV